MGNVVSEERLEVKRGRLKSNKVFNVDRDSIMCEGYGVIPKRVMRDKRLSVEAKAIYSYLCSYAGGGNEAYPSVGLIMSDLKMGESRFYKHMDLLTQVGYIVKHRMINDNNLMGNNVYEIVQRLEENSGYF